ncbi:MAG TPA: hypothetical protein VN903_31725 [Polyangia bacterium]|jgi:hypothetical protein|nr:hypothetical protein [Polyangia bacterium]
MSWLEVDQDQERPGEAAVEQLWRSIEVRPIDESLPAVEELLAELRRMYACGGAFLARFKVEGGRDLDWFASRNRLGEISFFSRFLMHPSVTHALPEPTRDATFNESFAVESRSSFTLDGELARAIVMGGAYLDFEGRPGDAKRLASRVCDALFGDRFLDVDVYRSGSAWSPWFLMPVFDTTYFIVDKREQVVSILIATDED